MKFKIPHVDWGPKKLRANFIAVTAKINAIDPLPGLGIELDERPDGTRISTTEAIRSAQGEGGGSASGTPVDIYGAVNGAPAVFHLLQSSPPTLVP